jgi:hypothetical protein
MIGRQFRTDESGYVILNADYDSRYDIQARFTGFLTRKAMFDATTIEKDPDEPTKTHNIEIVLDPIFKKYKGNIRGFDLDHGEKGWMYLNVYMK